MADDVKYRGKWIVFRERPFLDNHGNSGTWEYVARTYQTGHVAIIGIIHSTHLVLVKQFRPALNGWVLELPAGKIDERETVHEAAQRELAEETGYCGQPIAAGPSVFNSPGLTDEQVVMVRIDITGQRPARPDSDERIEVILAPLAGLKQWLSSQGGLMIDAKLWCLAEGLELARA